MSRSKHSYGGKHRHSSKRPNPESSFRCINCRQMVFAAESGSAHRNHCPLCLWSKHVDTRPGDRASECQGKMEPISIWVKDKQEWALVHRCTSCNVVKTNRIAADDNEFVLMSIASRPIAAPPFPLDRMP